LTLPTDGNINFANGVNILSTVGAGTYSNATVASYLLEFDGDIEFTSSTARIGNVDVITVTDSIRSPAYEFSNGVSILSNLAASTGDITFSGSDITGLGTNVTITADITDYVFYSNGTTTFPATGNITAGNLTVTGNIDQPNRGFNNIPGTDLYITAGHTQGCSRPGGDTIISGGLGYGGIAHNGGNVTLRTGDYYSKQWNFDYAGTLTFPSNLIIGSNPLSSGTVISQANASMIVSTTGNAATYIGWSELELEPGNIALVAFNDTTGAVAIQTGATTGPEAFIEWIFDGTGNLTLPNGGKLGDPYDDGAVNLSSSGNLYAGLASYDTQSWVGVVDENYTSGGIPAGGGFFINTNVNALNGAPTNYWAFLGNGATSFPDNKPVTITGNLTVGNLLVNGNSTIINTTSYSVTDNIIQMAADNPADTLDLGFVAHRTISGNLQHTGLVRDASAGVWKLFSNVATQPSTTVDFTGAVYDDLQLDKLFADTVHLTGTPPNTNAGAAGDQAGDIHIDSNYIYYCTSTFASNVYTVGFGGALTNTLFITQGAYPTPQVGWIVSHVGNNFTINTVTDDGNGSWMITWIGASYNVNTTPGDTATLTNPATLPAIWKTVPLTVFGTAPVTYSNANVTSYFQSLTSLALGSGAGVTAQGLGSVALGVNAGNDQGYYAVAIGIGSGRVAQSDSAVAVGGEAGWVRQGINSVAVGYRAGTTNQANSSIILNATGANLNATTANTFTVAPVRNDVANVAQVMFYNTTSKEITYGNTISIAGNLSVTGNVVQGSAYYETYGNIVNSGGNLTCNFNLGSTFYAALTANVTANFTNVNAITSTVTGATIIVDQGATAYRVANVQVNGVNQTVRWVGASAGVGTASNTDVMSFSLIHLGGGAWRVLGQISNYG